MSVVNYSSSRCSLTATFFRLSVYSEITKILSVIPPLHCFNAGVMQKSKADLTKPSHRVRFLIAKLIVEGIISSQGLKSQ